MPKYPYGRPLFCKHYSGVLRHDRCEAGVVYAEVRDESTRPHGLPCIQGREGGTTCPLREFPTAEELAEEDRRLDEMVRKINVSRAAIVEHTGGKRGVGGEISCPCCAAGTLRFTVSGYNGHIHARCSTAGCADWGE